MIKKFTLILAILIGSAIFLPSVITAQGLPPGYDDSVTVAPATSGYLVSNLGILLGSVSKWVAGISGFILFVYLIWGGAEWLLSGGDKAKIEAGRSRITQSIIGLAILACVFVFYTILINFLGLSTKVTIGGGNGGGGTTTTQPAPGGSNTTTGTTPVANTCAGNIAIGSTVSDNGAGGYCSNSGAASVRCMPAGAGGLNYPHLEPCGCLGGTTLLPGVDIRGCQ